MSYFEHNLSQHVNLTTFIFQSFKITLASSDKWYIREPFCGLAYSLISNITDPHYLSDNKEVGGGGRCYCVSFVRYISKLKEI